MQPLAAIKPISGWVFLAILTLVLLATVGAVAFFLHAAEDAPVDQRWSANSDAIRNGFLVGGGISGLAALFITVRRQRSSEIALQYTNYDATNRRNNELFTKAIEQLSNDSRAIRRGGVISLERLANENVDFRQSVVDVLCAYLRSSFCPPASVIPHHGEGSDQRELVGIPAAKITEDESAMEEYELRSAIQDTLTRHLQISGELYGQTALSNKTARPNGYWDDIDLNLERAVLIGFSLDGCRVGASSFSDAKFLGTAMFRSAIFTRSADFDGAKFGRDTWFTHTLFCADANFLGATFHHYAGFDNVQFCEPSIFTDATFNATASFTKSKMTIPLYFASATFHGSVQFDDVSVEDDGTMSFGPWNQGFEDATFGDTADLSAFATAEVSFSNCKLWPGKVVHVPEGWDVVELTGKRSPKEPTHYLKPQNEVHSDAPV
jgi:hypothetical protein